MLLLHLLFTQGKFSAMDVSEVLAVQLVHPACPVAPSSGQVGRDPLPQVGNVDAGSMGNFRSENLMLFYQW